MAKSNAEILNRASAMELKRVVTADGKFLGRIFDLQEDRPAALDHYRAAENAGSGLPEAKAAAELGLRQPYEPHRDPK